MMKYVLIPVIIISLLTGCTQSEKNRNTEVITVSIEPLRFFASAIAGEDYSINVIVPPGASPATYEPPPAVIKDLSNSGLIIINGYLGFEMAWFDRVLNINNDAKVLKLADSQDLIAAGSHRHGDVIHYSGVDPHFWVSPLRARIIAKDIKDFLVADDPSKAEIFESNYSRLDSIIKDTDSYIREVLGEAGSKSFMIFHPSLTYLAKDYDLIQISVETEGKEPSPSGLKKFIDTGRAKNIKAILVQREFDRKNANLIGNEIGAETIVIDPLSNDWVKSVREIADNIAGK